MSAQIGTREAHDQAFIAYLQGLVKQRDEAGPAAAGARAALAALRRGLGKATGEAPEMFRYLVPWTHELSRSREDAYYLVSALFAAHGLSWTDEGDEQKQWRTNLGASLAQLQAETGSESVERRVVALLNCNREDLPGHLRRIVMLLKAHDIGIDWLRLLRDIQRWDHEDRWVQRAWARTFWCTDTPLGGTPSQPQADSTSASASVADIA